MIGKNLARIRKVKMLGVNELSRMAGVNAGYISAIEKGTRKNPSLKILSKLASALDVTVDRLTGESARGIIDKQLEEKNMTLEELAQEAKVPAFWLQNLDTFVPGDWDGEDDMAYKWITQTAEVIGVPGNVLRAALARQEIPEPEDADPRPTVEEDFGGLINRDGYIRIPIYVDPESGPVGFDALPAGSVDCSEIYELQLAEETFVIVRKAKKAVPGTLMVVRLTGKISVRRVYQHQDHLLLVQESSHTPQMVPEAEPEILGQVIGIKKLFVE